MVIFGASGDLTKRKIFPALYALACRRLLPERFAVVGAARSNWSDDEFRDRMESAVREFGRDDFKQEVWDRLAEATRYVSMDFADDDREDKLASLLSEVDEERGTRGNRVYYFAVPPDAMPTIVRELGERRQAEGWVRLIIEKPFGHDLTSARRAHEPDQHPLHRGRGLPDRPLPRQGDGPEHARAALRERDLRADLEPPVHRPRADHGLGDDGHRGARRVLRQGGRDPRHLPEPLASARRADGDGAAHRLHGRLGAQREGQGAEGDPHARPQAHRPRAVWPGLRRRQGGRRLPRGGSRRSRLDD